MRTGQAVMLSGVSANQLSASNFVFFVNSAPTNEVLSADTVAENAANGTVVGTITGTDPNVGDVLHYSLINNAGGRFAIDTNTGVITVANGALLDFESVASHAITVRVTDQDGLTFDKSFTINVADLNEAPVAAGDHLTTSEEATLTLNASTLLANDSDPEGDRLTVTSVGNATHGAVSMVSDNITFFLAPNSAALQHLITP